MAGIDFRTLTENSLDMVCLLEVNGHDHQYLYVSPSAKQVIGWEATEMLKLSPEVLYPPASLAIIAADIDKLVRGESTSMVQIEANRKDGERIWLENQVRVLEYRERGEMLVMVVMRDVTERKRLEDRLAEQALVDALTGIRNRRSFDLAIEAEWKRTIRTGLPLSLVLLDIDHFKSFNDTYGHQVGDDCLRTVASVVQRTVGRPEDVVARYGGEELAVLLPATEMDGAEVLAQKLVDAVAALAIPHRGNAHAGSVVTISCGVSTALARIGGSVRMPEGLLMSADAALYRAKHQGKNCIASSLLLATTDLIEA